MLLENLEEYIIKKLGAQKTDDNTYLITLKNGKSFTVQKDAEFNGTIWPWKINRDADGLNTQVFSFEEDAIEYLYVLIQEKLTGERVIYEERKIPFICGENGAACRAPGKCNTALCRDCLVANKFFAQRDDVKLVYAYK